MKKKTAQSLYSTIKTMINKPKTHCFGIDCNVFNSITNLFLKTTLGLGLQLVLIRP